MKKTLILSLALALGITTVCAASPLKNYNAGKVAVDLGLNVPTSNTYEGHSVGSKKTSPYAGITVGLGSNTAINYKWNQYKNSGSNKVEAQQLNLMYKVLPVLDVYAGYVDSDVKLHGDSRSRIVARPSRCCQGRCLNCLSLLRYGAERAWATSLTAMKSA